MREYSLIEGKGHLITHLELGTLFFCASVHEYGKYAFGKKEISSIAFVLPRSVFTADQHSKFRAPQVGKFIDDLGITEVWDLENVKPLFNVPSCVIFARSPSSSPNPIPTQVFEGELQQKNTPLLAATEQLSIRHTKIHLVNQGTRSYWSEDGKAELVGSSPYASKFAQGATIVPRSCWFVEIVSDGQMGFDPSKPYLRTDPRATAQAKEAYKDIVVEGNVEKDFLYATFLSTDLLPFGFLDYRIVVLPVKPSGEKFVMIDRLQAVKDGNSHLAKWLEVCENEWGTRRKEKASRMTVYERLDHVHGITGQHHTAKYKVLYPSSATNLCSAAVPNKKISLKIQGQKVVLRNFVAESKTYFFETDNENEAQYLASILNSPTIDDLIKPMQSKGLWGPRDIHKKVWELPIPAYKEEKSSHRQLAKLGIECSQRVKEALPALDTKDITPGKIGRLRNDVRKLLKDELKEIDGIVKGIMKK